MNLATTVDAQLDSSADHLRSGRISEAVLAAEAALKAAWALPKTDPRVPQALRACGVMLTAAERFDEARLHLERLRDLYDPEDPRRAIAVSDLAQLALAQGDPGRAEALFEDAIDIIDENTDDAGMAVVPLLGLLAALKARTDLGAADEAKALAARAVDILITEQGVASVATADGLLLAALVDLQCGDAPGARALAERAAQTFSGRPELKEREATAFLIVSQAWRAEGDPARSAQARARAGASEHADALAAEMARLRGQLLTPNAPK